MFMISVLIILYVYLQKIDRGVAWVSGKIAQGTEVAGNLISKVTTYAQKP